MVYSRIVISAKQSLDSSLTIKSKAKELRKNSTSAEKKLWQLLKRGQINGLHFRRQHPYGIYILDFFCFKANLAIEVDGPIHMQKKEYDYERTKFIESTGVEVLRFRNEEVENSIEQVIKAIHDALDHRNKSQFKEGIDE